MKTKKGFNIRKLCGQNMIVAEGMENLDFCNIISMNESSALLWEALQGKEFTVEDVTRLLLDNYQVDDDTPLDEELARHDAQELVEAWTKAGILEL